MKILVTYDIIDTKIRNRLIDELFNFGFERLQYSIFLGEINSKKIRKLVNSSEKIINKKEDSLYFFSLCEEDFKRGIFLGKAINKKYIDYDILYF